MAYGRVVAVFGLLVAGCGPTTDGGRADSEVAASVGDTAGTSGATTENAPATSGGSEGAGPEEGSETAAQTTSSPGTTGAPAQCEAGGEWGADDAGGDTQDDGAEGSDFGMGDDMPLSVYEVQQGATFEGTRIVISNVLVSSPPSQGEAIGGFEFFVQELEGGPFSGLRVQTFSSVIANSLAQGQTIDVSGRLARNGIYYMLLIEGSEDVVALATADPPAPPVVVAAELSTDAESARQYEGVVVRVQEATVTDPEPCDGEFTLDDTVRVDDRFMPNALQTPTMGEVIAQVDGILVFAQDEYELAPTVPLAR
ncbi:MAG: hypothetical protein AAF721_04630 [Myxococcota bacterium]